MDPSRLHEKTVAMTEALILGPVRQHELTLAAEKLNAQLRVEIAHRQRVEESLRLKRTLSKAFTTAELLNMVREAL